MPLRLSSWRFCASVCYSPHFVLPVSLGGAHVFIWRSCHRCSGSPFSVDVGGEPSRKVTEQITRHKPAADVMHVGSDCELRLKVPPGEFLLLLLVVVVVVEQATAPMV